MRTRMLLSAATATALLTTAPAALAAEWSVSDAATFYIDATVTHTATPDIVNMTVDCQLQEPVTREALRAKMAESMDKLQVAAGSSAKVRRNGTPTVYPSISYDPNTGEKLAGETTYTGNFGFAVQLKTMENAQKLATAVEGMGCSFTWDARIVYTGKYARQNRDELIEQINEKKEFYEEILGIKLTQVSSVSISTYADSGGYGYYGGGGYDPETNTVTATTTMNVTFDMPGKKKN